MREQIDVDFSAHIVPPAETFGDTMRLHYGWSSPVRDADGQIKPELSFVADTDNVDEHIEYMLRFAAGTYAHFGGGEGRLPFPVPYEDVLAFVSDYDTQSEFSVYSFEEEIAGLAHRYLNGQGDDYDRFHALVDMYGF